MCEYIQTHCDINEGWGGIGMGQNKQHTKSDATTSITVSEERVCVCVFIIIQGNWTLSWADMLHTDVRMGC